ncbi:hypothetical protein BJ741DRAFT_599711 [Chytriomyces cf. hyalinus JEL632]|nr:hypothetical protein BJ741DRAFT_599711 [Chytriomyces cf. hyalinus JEL632]
MRHHQLCVTGWYCCAGFTADTAGTSVSTLSSLPMNRLNSSITALSSSFFTGCALSFCECVMEANHFSTSSPGFASTCCCTSCFLSGFSLSSFSMNAAKPSFLGGACKASIICWGVRCSPSISSLMMSATLLPRSLPRSLTAAFSIISSWTSSSTLSWTDSWSWSIFVLKKFMVLLGGVAWVLGV